MLSHLRRGHHHEFDGNSMPIRTTNGYFDHHWKSSAMPHGSVPSNYPTSRYNRSEPYNDRANSSVLSNQLGTDVYPTRSIPGGGLNPDLSRAPRVDAYLLAIVRVEDKRNAFYSAEVVSKLRQKEQTQSFINKPCSLFVTDRALIVFDRATNTIAESIPLENVDPTCVHADVPDQLNDIFMYRLFDRQLTTTASQASSTNSNDASPVVVFKCANNEARILVDSIRTASGKPIKQQKSHHSAVLDRRITDTHFVSSSSGGGGGGGGHNLMPHFSLDPPAPPPPPPVQMNNPPYMTTTTTTQQRTQTVTREKTAAATDYYKHLTEDLNKCFDDIELFVRYLEALTEYTKELERDHRRKEKKSALGLKQMIEKLPDDRYFIDILQKFKHSFNLLGELKHIIHNPNAPELIHYLLSPLQFILHTLRAKHLSQLQLAREIWIPAFTRETRDLLLNCLTSKEQDILRNLGPAWIRTLDDSTPKFTDYRPVFFEGRAVWIQDTPSMEYPPAQPLQAVRSTERIPVTHPFTQFDERPQSVWTSTRQSNPIDQSNTNGLVVPQNTTFIRQSSTGQFDTSTIDRTVKNGIMDNYNAQMQNEHAWAIDRKRVGARICAVKIDRQGQNPKELTVHRGELIEIEDSSKKWWYARNFRGEVGYVPNNILEEIEIEHRPIKISPSIPSAANSHRSLANTNSRSRYN